MIDIISMIMVQKLKWIKMYINNHKCQWLELMESLINVKNLQLLNRGNFEYQNSVNQSSFYQEVLQILHKLKSYQSQDNESLISQYVFYNKNFKIGNEMIYDREIMQAGIWKVCDLLDCNKKFISFKLLQQRGVSQSKYLLWQSIITIAKRLKVTCLETNQANDLEIELPNKEIIDIANSASKDSYNKLVKLKCEKSKAIDKYILTFNILDIVDLKNVYLIPHFCTKDNFAKDLQYQILHRYLPTNYLLHKMNKLPTMRCTFCELHTESIPHLFFCCVNVKIIWATICTIWRKLEGGRRELKCKDVVLGYGLETNTWRKNVFINNVILSVKSFIWNSRKRGTTVNLKLLKVWFQEKSLIDGSLQIVSQ